MPQLQLPPELLRRILHCLDQDEMRITAAVSRDFYREAWRAGLLMTREFTWFSDINTKDELSELSEVVDYVVEKDLRLALLLALHQIGPAGAPVLGPPASAVLRLIPKSLPIMAHLCLTVRGCPDCSIVAALSHRAPHLESLDLRRLPPLVLPDRTPVLSADIFDGDAPKLGDVTLNGIHLPANPIAAFSRVVSLTFKGAALPPHVVLAQHFPALRYLLLSDESRVLNPTVAIPHNLHGAQLEWLVIAESVSGTLMSALLCGDNAASVPNVEYRCEEVEWTESLWHRTNDGTFSIRISACSPPDTDNLMISVVPAHKRWYRGYEILEFLSLEFPLSDLPLVSQRLTYLRMDNYYITGFLAYQVVWVALLEIQLDFQQGGTQCSMVWPPDWIDTFDDDVSFDVSDGSAPTFSTESYSHVGCTSLRKLRLFAIYEKIQVACQEVGYLGRALSQCLRPKENRASLELHGVELTSDTQCGLLEEAFSSVIQLEFAGCESPVGDDSGLWDIADSCPFP